MARHAILVSGARGRVAIQEDGEYQYIGVFRFNPDRHFVMRSSLDTFAEEWRALSSRRMRLIDMEFYVVDEGHGN